MRLFLIIGLSMVFVIGCVNLNKNRSRLVEDHEISTLQFERAPSDQPVVDSGLEGLPANPGDPFVLKGEDGYHLFVSILFCNLNENGSQKYNRPVGEYYFSMAGRDFSLCNPDKYIYTTGYAYSTDKGLTWKFRATPIFYPSGGAAWDSGFNETANVVRKGNALYLFYSAFKKGEDYKYQVGVASLELEDLPLNEILFHEDTRFHRNGRSEPLIPRKSGGFEDNTQEPSAIFLNGQFEVYYVGLRKDGEGNVTGIALHKALFTESLEAISPPTRLFTYDPFVDPQEDPLTTNIEEMIYANDTYYLFYTTEKKKEGYQHQDEKIAYMASKDQGITWSDEQILLTARQGDKFDNWGIMAPTIVLEENKFILFYSAWQNKNAPCADEPGRYGGEYNGKCIYQTIGRAEQVLPDHD